MNSSNFEVNDLQSLDQSSARSMIEEFRALRDEVKDLKAWKESHQNSQPVLFNPSFSSPISIAAVNPRPFSIDRTPPSYSTICEENFDQNQKGSLNNAAQAIFQHKIEAREWQSKDIDDCPLVLTKLNSASHYLSNCKRKKGKEAILHVDGSRSETYLLMLRKYLIEKKEISAAQGKDVQRILQRMFKCREGTESGDLLSLDPVRKEFTTFIGDICLGKLVNPKVPRQTGATANDLNDRIERIANKVRELFFGPPNEFFFICRKENGSERIISLPDKEDIQQEIKSKLSDKEGSETKYIRQWLIPFDAYFKMRETEFDYPEDASHEASRELIETWRNNRKLKGYVTEESNGVMNSPSFSDGTPQAKKKGHGKGKSRIFSYSLMASSPSESSQEIAAEDNLEPHSMFGLSSRNLTPSSSSFYSSSSSSSSSSASAQILSTHCAEKMFDIVSEAEQGEYSQPPAKIPRVSDGHVLFKKIASANQRAHAAYAAKFTSGYNPNSDDDSFDGKQAKPEEDEEQEEDEEDEEEDKTEEGGIRGGGKRERDV